MPNQVSTRVSKVEAVSGTTLRRSQRQLLAAMFDEAARQQAVSIQARLTTKGTVCVSMYYSWRPRDAGGEDVDEEFEGEQKELAISVQGEAPKGVEPSATPNAKAPTNDRFTVKLPGALEPAGHNCGRGVGVLGAALPDPFAQNPGVVSRVP